jgi:hypothetical protein
MMRKLTLVLVATVALLTIFGAGTTAQAIIGTYTTLSFPGATTSSCGNMYVGGGSVTTEGPWTATFNAFDGNGTLLRTSSSSGGSGETYGAWGTESFDVQPAANPIRVTLVIDEGSGPVTYFDQSADNPCLPASGAGYAGPPIPSGFVLRTITCDVAVFDLPGGQPVGANRIRGGQTWFVNPVPVKTSAGESWTEIFVSGSPNGYIPTRCVG